MCDIHHVEIAPSGRSKCGRCKKPIPKGSSRLACFDESPYQNKYYLCEECGKAYIEEQRNALSELAQELELGVEG